jgi:hypothetical protein
MKVYVLLEVTHDGDLFRGVFNSSEKAWQEANTHLAYVSEEILKFRFEVQEHIVPILIGED